MTNPTHAAAATTPGAPPKYKRRLRNILIHKPMQREFTMILIGLLIVSTLVIGYVIHHTIREAAFGGGFHFGKINPYEVLNEVRYQLLIKIFLVLFATMGILGTFGIFFLHRVAGPVYRMHRIFLKINDGEVEKLTVPTRLREGDFFQETVAEIDRMIEKMRSEVNTLRLVKQKFDQLGSVGSQEVVAKSIQEIRSLIESELKKPSR